MPTPGLFTIPLVSIFGVLLLIHAYWAFGGQWGTMYAVPIIRGRRSFDPSPAATWVVCGLLAVAMILVMRKGGWIGPTPAPVIVDIGVWGISSVFLLRAIGNLRTFGFFKTITGTPFSRWDSRVYSPLCLLIALLAAALGHFQRKG
jgi:hypothetical protein